MSVAGRTRGRTLISSFYSVPGTIYIRGKPLISYFCSVPNAVCIRGKSLISYFYSVPGAVYIRGKSMISYFCSVPGAVYIRGKSLISYFYSVPGAIWHFKLQRHTPPPGTSEIHRHPPSLKLIQFRHAGLHDAVYSLANIQNRRSVCRYDAGLVRLLFNNVLQNFPLCRHIQR